MFLPPINSEGPTDCEIIYWESGYYCREKMSLEKFFSAFRVGSKEPWEKDFMKLKYGTRAKHEFPLYVILLKDIQVSECSVSILGVKHLNMYVFSSYWGRDFMF